MDKEDHCRCDCENYQERDESDIGKEGEVVVFADAKAQPIAMVVDTLNACIAITAMRGTWRPENLVNLLCK